MSIRTLLQHFFEPDDTKDLRTKVESIEKRMREMDDEWTDVYDKFRSLHMRVARRVQRLDENSSQEEPQGDGGEQPDEGGPLMGLSLSPRAREIQKQILARRARGAQGGGE
jgi:hypothetical protein